jgi:hypothetical protein
MKRIYRSPSYYKTVARLVRRLPQPAGEELLINVELQAAQQAELLRQLTVWAGLIESTQRLGPDSYTRGTGGITSYTLRFWRRESAANFLKSLNLLGRFQLEDYEVQA